MTASGPVCAWAPVTHWEPAAGELVLLRACGHGVQTVPSCQAHLDEHPVGQAAPRASRCATCGAENHLTVMAHQVPEEPAAPG